MNKKVIKLIFSIVLIGVALYWIRQHFITQPNFINGRQAPDFSAQLITGKDVKLSDFREDYVLIDFWASWCGSCRRQNPKIVNLFEKYEHVSFINAKKFIVLSIALEKEGETLWEKAIEADNLHWPYHILDTQKSIASLFGVTQIPTSFLVNPDGIIIGVNQSVEEIEKLLNSYIKKE